MADDSGGLSASKAAGQEEENSTAPFPEKFIYIFFMNWTSAVAELDEYEFSECSSRIGRA
ncbi:hypothetical protein RchiOBHm_Chr1g0331421 [Rosa chinensis]|uniref:Uncharacterized protein n=1 Tax=Rosa chinensis TaxID=74649 RepID=A0A2P6SBJ6_ROSCH|nr:hypothetical protein RchiOBHm_Chr1g0331421 [Rosa chinensis]